MMMMIIIMIIIIIIIIQNMQPTRKDLDTKNTYSNTADKGTFSRLEIRRI